MKDKTKPLFHWYVDCAYGKELVLALYTRPCRYGRCAFCALPNMSLGGEAVSAYDIEHQIDYILAHYSQTELEAIGKVSVYTASSSLDQECLPTRSLMYLALKTSELKNVKLMSLETRPEYVEDWELKAIKNVFDNQIALEIGIGYETYDPHLRNIVLEKGLTAAGLTRLMKMLADNKALLKAYIMLKPHYSLTEEAGIVEAKNGVQELAGLGSEYGVPVSIHLNPTYIAHGCRLTDDMVKFGYQPPELDSVLQVLYFARELNLQIYAGLDDEGIAIEGGTFRSTGYDREKTIAAIIAFNNHQDADRLKKEIVMNNAYDAIN